MERQSETRQLKWYRNTIGCSRCPVGEANQTLELEKIFEKYILNVILSRPDILFQIFQLSIYNKYESPNLTQILIASTNVFMATSPDMESTNLVSDLTCRPIL